MNKAIFGMATLAALVLVTGAALACPYDKSAQTTDQQTTASSDQVPLPTGGSTTETKTGG